MEAFLTSFFKSKDKISSLTDKLLIIWAITPVIVLFSIITCNDLVIVVWNQLFLLIGYLGLFIGLFYLIINKISIKKIIKDKNNIPIILFSMFLIITLISCLLASNKFYSLLGTSYRRDGFITYLGYAGFFILGMFSKNRRKIFLYFIISAAILNGLNLYSRLTIMPLVNAKTSIFFNPNHYAYYITLSILISFGLYMTEDKLKNKLLFLIIFMISVVDIVLNDTFGSYLGVMASLFIALIYYLIKKKYQVFIPIIIFIIISITVTNGVNVITFKNFGALGRDTSSVIDYVKDKKGFEEVKTAGSWRAELWIVTSRLILEKPILGYGLENLQEVYESNNSFVSDRPHNLILQLSATSGIPALICYMSGFLIIMIRPFIDFIKKRKIDKTTEILFFTLGAYFASSMFGNTMFYTSPYFLLLLGMLFKRKV